MESQNVTARERLSRFIGHSVEPEVKVLGFRTDIGAFVLRLFPFVALECGALWVFFFARGLFGQEFEAIVVLLHGFASLALAIGIHPFLPQSYQASRALSHSLIFGLSSSLPIFGPSCVFIILSLIRKTKSCSQERSKEPWVVGSKVPSAEYSDYSSGRDAAESILQVMIGSDPIARRNLILATKRLPPDQAIPVLRTGLRDSDEETKLYSQAMLSQIEEKYEKTIADLKIECEQRPEDLECRLKLAEQFFEVVDLELVADPELQEFYVASAIDLLEQVVSAQPSHERALIDLVRYHLRIHDSQSASSWLHRLRDLKVSNDLLEGFEIEILFNQRSWETFRERIRAGMTNRFCDPALQAAGEFWLGQNSGRGRRFWMDWRERFAVQGG